MNGSRLRNLLAIAACAVLEVACADQPSAAPVPGDLVVTLTTPPSLPAALMLSLEGPGVLTLEAVDSSQISYWHPRSDREAMAIIIGAIRSGPILRARVPDVARVGEYTARLYQISAPDGSLTSANGYTVTVAR